jgi:outer membrane protein assembly factor BamB
MDGDGIAGVVGDGDIVIVADRNRRDSADIFRALDMKTGDERWKLEYSTSIRLDYGNSPRATPLIAGDRAFLLGAAGHLHAVELSSGDIVWSTVLPRAFNGKMPFWGFSTSPLLVDETISEGKLTGGKLIVPPGASDAGLVALDAVTGNVVWKSENGRMAGYASPLVATLGGVRQIIFYDSQSLGGWDVTTGKRLWELIPKHRGDFNVPTPIPLSGDRLFVMTENNLAMIYRFHEDGRIDPEPIATQDDVSPDSNSAVASADRIYVVDGGLYCLDGTDLSILWMLEDDALNDYATLLLGDNRLLIGTYRGEILLVDVSATPGKIVSRFCPFDDDEVVLSHPAVIGDCLMIRSTSTVVCVRL